jgi:hypothetical protein
MDINEETERPLILNNELWGQAADLWLAHKKDIQTSRPRRECQIEKYFQLAELLEGACERWQILYQKSRVVEYLHSAEKPVREVYSSDNFLGTGEVLAHYVESLLRNTHNESFRLKPRHERPIDAPYGPAGLNKWGVRAIPQA